ncbi:MAG: NAD(P)-dependent alcohol dehydrogenase [Anaerolineae bacterium]|jgi:NADPH:quinone reductase-like Zn-dependent oxidoreductase|nr:NAD(P)-dependent alcohol dehydrogenase [Anaerolineae bacterium]
MKAFVYSQYGSPDVLRLQDIPRPTPQPGQVLVRVVASSVNPLDWHQMRADPFLVRLSNGLFKPKNPISIPGADVAGVVEAIGEGVTRFRPGDAVYGDAGGGGLAEYTCVKEKGLVHKPDNLTFEQAAAIPVAAITAWQALMLGGERLDGKRVLINGASGGIGTFAIQMAKALGAHVTAVCSTRNVELVRGLGADVVVDYTRENITKTSQRFNLILDNVGNFGIGDHHRLLTPDGVGAGVGFTSVVKLMGLALGGMWLGWRTKQKAAPMMANIKQADLEAINTLVKAGKVVPVIDRCYPFEQTPDALRYLETLRARGKVVVTVSAP